MATILRKRLLLLGIGNCLSKRMNQKMTSGMAMWKGTGNTITYFSPEMTSNHGSSESLPDVMSCKIKKGEEKWSQHFNSIFFHKSKDLLTSSIFINKLFGCIHWHYEDIINNIHNSERRELRVKVKEVRVLKSLFCVH